MPRIKKDFEKVRAVILSCDEKKYIPAAKQMINNFYRMHKDLEYYDILERFYKMKRNEFN